jgi:hypothetical protein
MVTNWSPGTSLGATCRAAAVSSNVYRFVLIFGIDDDGQEELLGVRAGESGVPVGTPLHGCADAVPIAEVDVVAHADFVAVVQHGRARHREEQGVHQFDALAAVVAEQRCQATANAEVDAHLPVVRVHAVHVVAFIVGDHFERQLVVVAEEDRPLAVSGMAGVWSMISMIGKRSSMRSAMNRRGMRGKWNAMLHSSPSPK